APTITASGSTGLYRWYDVPTGGSPLGTGSTFSPGALYSNSNLVYYVEAVDNISAPSCVSPRAAIMLQPTPLATPVVSGNTTVLCGGTTTLSASASASYINWYTQPSGGTPVYSGASFSIPPVYSSGITYYVEAATHPGPIATVQFNYTGGQQTWV